MKPSILLIALLLFATALIADPPQPKANAAPTAPKDGENKKPAVTSIAIRVRRVTYEDAYVGVPVTEDLMQKNADGTVKVEKDGTARLDPKALMAEAIRISKDKRVEWKEESASTEPHPTQQQAPEGRRKFDPSLEAPTKR